MGREKMEKERLLFAIRSSIENHCQGFYLCYQPLVSARDKRTIGAEALLRWAREPYGEIGPNEFIPILEKEPCFFQLGQWILQQAVMDGKRLIAHDRTFVVHVNVTIGQFEQDDFLEKTLKLLQELDFPAENLCLELTERGEVVNIQALGEKFDHIRKEGIQIALDDFGTGTAALHLLREWKVDRLEIDRMFVQNIMGNFADQAIVQVVIDCAKQLGLCVCLEGVETEEQYRFLQRFDVEMHQGYYYGKPVELNDFLEMFL